MSFEWPYLLVTLGLVPILLGFYLLSLRRRRAYAVRFTNLALLRDVMGPGPGLRRHLPPLLFVLGLAALLVGLARPHTVVAIPRDQTSVMLVLDISGSMAAEDLKPNRLEAAKRAALAFVDALPDNAQVGLVTFSTGATVSAPLSPEAASVRAAIRGLRTGGGTAIGEGMAAALDQLSRRPLDDSGGRAPGLVVLLSDGHQTSGRARPEEMSARAVAEGVTVHTVGIGERGAVPVVGGATPVVLDEATLQQIARSTSGEYFYAAEAAQLERIYNDLGSRVSWVEEWTEVTAVASGLSAVLLIAGGLLSLRWFQRLP